MTLGACKKNIMPAFPFRLSSRYILAGMLVAIGVAAFLGAPTVQRLASNGWWRYRNPAPAGAGEARVRQHLLGNEPMERRFAGLFEYFLNGFVRHADPGYARVVYAGFRSRNGYAEDGLEGFARTAPLLAAWIYSGRPAVLDRTIAGQPVDLVAVLRTGILSGVDPRSSEYWGAITNSDQRIVEAADVARVLWLTRASIWDKLTDAQRQMASAWLLAATRTQTPRNNWMLFPVVVSVVLLSLNADHTPPGLLAHARELFADYRQYYLEHGWFYDRPHGVDFYNAWGITYDLFWIHAADPAFEADFIVDAIEKSADLTQYLISPRGIPIMGRSICYRTAVPVPLVAATLLGSSQFPVGRAVRGLDVVWRYFVAHESLRDGALTQGYFGADPRLLDVYSGPGSCHWGLRSLVLAFMHPPGDRFWTAAQLPLPVEESDYRLELSKLGWLVEGHRQSGGITITIPRNPADVNSIEEYSWQMRAKEVFVRTPLRPSNHEVKYESRHYSSAAPFPLN